MHLTSLLTHLRHDALLVEQLDHARRLLALEELAHALVVEVIVVSSVSSQ